MLDIIILFFANFPPEVLTFLIAMTPVSELRGAIPAAIGLFGFSAHKAFLIALFGNILPAVVVLLLLNPVEKLFNLWEPAKRFLQHIFDKTRVKHSAGFNAIGSILLILLVAIPLPFTGAWTGALVAYLFGVPFWRAILLLFIGLIIAALIVTLTTLGISFLV